MIKEVVLKFKYMYPGEGGISSIITGLDSIWSATPLATILLQYMGHSVVRVGCY